MSLRANMPCGSPRTAQWQSNYKEHRRLDDGGEVLDTASY